MGETAPDKVGGAEVTYASTARVMRGSKGAGEDGRGGMWRKDQVRKRAKIEVGGR